MSEILVCLEQMGIEGSNRAERHFAALVECAKRVFPEPLWPEIPSGQLELGGIFTASSRTVYIQIFNNLPDYEPVTAVFEYDTEKVQWEVKRYSISLGLFASTYHAYTVEDGVLLSRQMASIRAKATVAQQASEETACAKTRVM